MPWPWPGSGDAAAMPYSHRHKSTRSERDLGGIAVRAVQSTQSRGRAPSAVQPYRTAGAARPMPYSSRVERVPYSRGGGRLAPCRTAVALAVYRTVGGGSTHAMQPSLRACTVQPCRTAGATRPTLYIRRAERVPYSRGGWPRAVQQSRVAYAIQRLAARRRRLLFVAVRLMPYDRCRTIVAVHIASRDRCRRATVSRPMPYSKRLVTHAVQHRLASHAAQPRLVTHAVYS